MLAFAIHKAPTSLLSLTSTTASLSRPARPAPLWAPHKKRRSTTRTLPGDITTGRKTLGQTCKHSYRQSKVLFLLLLNLSRLKLYCFYFRLLFLKVKAHNNKEKFAFCSVKGCERVKITAVIPKGSPPSNCLAQAYPKHAEVPVVDVPMPRKIPSANLVTKHKILFIGFD